jgi:hypothetical protein
MVLAAGLGTRMRPLTLLRAKPALPVMNRPLIHWTLERLARHGIREVVVNLHHLPASVVRAVGDGSAFGLKVQYTRERTILGTGGGPRKARPLLGDGPVLIVNGDVLFDFDLGDLMRQHRRRKASATLAQLSTGEVRVDVIHRGVGAITESDVLFAKASGAIILGFHVRPDANARAAAERESVDVRTYRVIYEAVEDVRSALEGLLKPEEKEVVLGEAEVLQTFKISKVGTIAGCVVRQGTITRTAKVRVVRDGTVVYTGGLSSLKRFKDDVKEVREGLECGIGVENYNDLKVGDRIEAFRIEEIKRTLQPAAGATA